LRSALASASEVDIRTPAPPSASPPLVSGYAGAAIEVADLGRARHFYADILGLGSFPELVRTAEPRTLPDGGVHLAYRLGTSALESALSRLAAAGVEVHTYREDRPAERDQNRYCTDPDGNRVQLVLGEEPGIDHAAIEVHDIEWAEVFYTHVLGASVETRVGWHMRDFDGALAWGAGQDDCAPGARRWDKRYTTIEHKGQLPRPNAQLYLTLAPGVTLGVYLATEHRQEPPPEQFRGTPCVRFRAGPGGVAAIERRLREVRLRCLPRSADTGGPYERQDGALFLRDPGGNFLEIVEA
jgi:catechol 2,3-dioxygenase-like lactoylglutathione lyase family enzyme